jgi:hypothetical protein
MLNFGQQSRTQLVDRYSCDLGDLEFACYEEILFF